MTRHENHGLSNCLGSIYCVDCGGVCSQDLDGEEPSCRDYRYWHGGPQRQVTRPDGTLAEVPVRFGTWESYQEFVQTEARIAARREGR